MPFLSSGMIERRTSCFNAVITPGRPTIVGLTNSLYMTMDKLNGIGGEASKSLSIDLMVNTVKFWMLL